MNRRAPRRPRNADHVTDKVWAQLFRFQFCMYLVEMSKEVASAVGNYISKAREEGRLPQTCSCETVRGRKCTENACRLRAFHCSCNQDCGENCENKRFYGKWKGREMDLGLYAKDNEIVVGPSVDIPEGTIICQVTGVLRFGKPWKDQRYAYPIEGLEGLPLYMDFEKKGNLTRYLQHSENPNCEILTWIVGNEVKLILRTLRNIKRRHMLKVKFPQFMKDFHLPLKPTQDHCVQSYGDNTPFRGYKTEEYKELEARITKSHEPPSYMKYIKKPQLPTGEYGRIVSDAPNLTLPNESSSLEYLRHFENKRMPEYLPNYTPKPHKDYWSAPEE